MKDKNLIKVIATSIAGPSTKLETSVARGITALKRGQSILDFVTTFMKERDIVHFTLHQREEHSWATSPIMFLNQEPKLVLVFNFLEFPASDLGFYAKDLEPLELERDMKKLAKVING